MPPAESQNTARAEVSREGGTLFLRLGGDWRITETHPVWADTVTGALPQRVVLQADGLGTWDSSLALFLGAARLWQARHGVELEEQGLPAEAGRLAALLANKPAHAAKPPTGLPNLVTGLGLATVNLWAEAKDLAQLVGECVFSMGRFVRGQAHFRWKDCFIEMQQCGAMALPIVGLISFLSGVTMAYTAAIVLRLYGGDIYVADLMGLAVLREMGALMTGIVLAGRTGAAFAATLGNMKANEEIDALETLGVSPVDFLVMPRIAALFFMMPLLALYSNLLGMLGGFAVAGGLLKIPASLYWAETKTIIDLSDLNTGLIKAATFGVLIGLSGCLRGLQAERSAAGVGDAATRAVVTALLLLVVADSIYAVAFNILGW
jgi:phospholipid/cholesterol/gamma-HCH transport system permease protein